MAHRFNAVPGNDGDLWKLLDRQTGATILAGVFAWQADEAAERLNDDVERWRREYGVRD